MNWKLIAQWALWIIAAIGGLMSIIRAFSMPSGAAENAAPTAVSSVTSVGSIGNNVSVTPVGGGASIIDDPAYLGPTGPTNPNAVISNADALEPPVVAPPGGATSGKASLLTLGLGLLVGAGISSNGRNAEGSRPLPPTYVVPLPGDDNDDVDPSGPDGAMYEVITEPTEALNAN